MSAIVSVPVPAQYRHSPYQLFVGERISNSQSIDQLQKHAGSRAIPPTKSNRWSPNSALSGRTAEAKQMTDDGSVPRPPPAEGYHWQRPNPDTHSSSDQVSPNHRSAGRQTKMEDQASHGVNLPPTNRSVEARNEGTERRTSRSLGVHSILNPPHTEELTPRHRRRSFAQMEEDVRKNPSITNILMGRPQDEKTNHDESSLPLDSGVQRAPRRILTPISPRIQSHRAASSGYGQGRQPTGTINAQETPFLSPSARFHSQEASPPPQPPAAHSLSSQAQPQQNQQHTQSGHISQQSSPFIMPAAPAPAHALVEPSRRASVSVVHSARASPSPSNYSSYSQSEMSQGGLSVLSRRTSPSSHDYQPGPGQTASSSRQLSPSPVIGSLSNGPPLSLEGDHQQAYNGMISGGQNYQVLTIDTTQGHMQMPVEVQTASRVADEKRKRNAGASARFRQRRKEKEREASSRISNLEQELAWAQEDSRHYKQERDIISEYLTRNFPQYKTFIDERPRSPIHTRDLTRRRLSMHDLSSAGDSASPRTMPGPAPAMSVLEHDRYEPRSTMLTDRIDQTGAERPATRRRTETFQPEPLPIITTPGHPSYQPASPPFPPFGGRPPAQLPSPRQQPQPYHQPQAHQDQQRQRIGQAQLPPIGHAQFRQDPPPEQRSWPPQPDHQRQ
ncbi:hypothetical protein FKW77_001388 [Venturia effusa]|uniref:BZIP domain-containing protein n=1 Tax=Venturia effusa TaxID=50376 RepID=A0A517KZ16_9PEZI|nr:hypothetical protein FKW77_001388 [Venturia effusa]